MKISVIVPVYNVESLLERCLDSLENQTLEGFEVIAINDGSTDNSNSILKKYKDGNPKLFRIIDQQNKGLSATRNIGVEEAKGKYIYYLDSDDYIEPNALENMFNIAESHELDYLVDGFKTVKENGEYIDTFDVGKIPKNTVIQPKELKELFHIHNAVWNRLYLKDRLIESNLQFKEGIWYEDLLYTHQYYIYSKRAMVIDKQYINYVQREGSIMASMGSEKNKDILVVFEELIRFYKENGVYEEYHEDIELLAINHLYISTMVRLIRAGNLQLANEIYFEFNKMFPNYKSNFGIKKLSFKHKIIFKLLNSKHYSLISLIFNSR